jgi:hypothetical protein
MSANKTPVPINASPVRGYRRELQHLYARRTAIATLIESLEEYHRFRARPFESPKQQTA